MSSPAPQLPDRPALFTPAPPPVRSFPTAALLAAGLVIVGILAALLLLGRHHASPANGPLPADPYAGSLPVSGAAMSESTSLSGGKSTFIDGHIRNTGSRTVTGVTVQVLFRNSEGMPPAIETLSLPLIRTREPYVDTQPVAAAPIQPGEDREFRLIFETIPGNWNVQLPEITVVRVTWK